MVGSNERARNRCLEVARGETLERERERLAWQIGEVDKLAPGAQEWDELNGQHQRLSHAQALMDAAQQTLNALEDDEQGGLTQLSKAQDLLSEQGHVEPEFQNLAEVLSSSLAQVSDVVHTLHTWLRRTDLDPDRLAELDERMALWQSLSRRYKRLPQELPDLLAGWKMELSRLDAAADLEGLEAQAQAAEARYRKEARTISQARGKAAPKLSATITQAMQGLGMQGGQFKVDLQALEQAAQHGLDDVQFLVAGHAGSTPRPVGKVASGGELSRIALAIAVTTSELGEAGTLIFDEVDSGVGGAVAETVGRLMKQLGRHRQVLAVTHLPQVAACADQHLVVSKQLSDGQIGSQVRPSTGEDRVQEIARMLGGEKLSATTLAHAREMLGSTAV